MGPKTVSRLRTTASGRPTARSCVPGGVTATVVVTLPSFAREEVERRSGTARAARGRGTGPPRGRGPGGGDEQPRPRKPAPVRAWQGRLIRVLAEPPCAGRAAVAWRHGQPDRGARVPRHAARQDHPGSGRGAALRAASPCPRPAPRGGGPARGAEHRLLHPPGEGESAR